MKIKITEIEATSEDLRQSQSLSDALLNILRRNLLPNVKIEDEELEEEPEVSE